MLTERTALLVRVAALPRGGVGVHHDRREGRRGRDGDGHAPESRAVLRDDRGGARGVRGDHLGDPEVRLRSLR